jgi:cell division protein FtsN
MRSQRGGFVLGMIVGVLVGLSLALGVALWVTKVPIPFVNKVPQRTAEQEALEVERNKNWNPNAPLAGKPAQKPLATPEPTTVPPPGIASAPATAVPRPPPRDPAAILAGEPPSRSAKPGTDPFNYFVQAGAFARAEDAEQQRAKLAMLGFAAKISEREQSGRTMYRVRVGPFDDQEQADAAKNRMQGSGVDAALVRVER